MNTDMAVSYVRDLIVDLTDSPRPQPDHEGDIPVVYRGCQCYVRVLRIPDDVVVQCFSVLCDIDDDTELLAALNPINTRLLFARAFHVEGQLLLENDMFAQDLSLPALGRNLFFLSEATSAFGPELVKRFGGTPRFEPTAPPPPPDVPVGMYL